MEILSTGEKIKRARIYKGLTLKDVCDDKLSVSKLSCIENNKINPDVIILDHISKRLKIDINYLKQDIKQQIENNLISIMDNPIKYGIQYEKDLKLNLNAAVKNEYYQLAFTSMHLLFNFYINNKKNDNLTIIITQYYDLCEKTANIENRRIYFMDVARYLYNHKEYVQAASYYNNVRKDYDKSNVDKPTYIQAVYSEAACFIMLKNYERAYEIAIKLPDLIDNIKEDLEIAEIYQMLALLCLRTGKNEFFKYEELSYKYYKKELSYKAEAIFNYAKVMFETGDKERGEKYIKSSLKLYPKTENGDWVNFLLMTVNILVKNNLLDFAQELCEQALNFAISINKVMSIERAYYYKSIIFFKKKDFDMCEMFLSLSLDYFGKYAKKDELIGRYLEIGNMYNDMQNYNESIKYFTLAISLNNKL